MGVPKRYFKGYEDKSMTVSYVKFGRVQVCHVINVLRMRKSSYLILKHLNENKES